MRNYLCFVLVSNLSLYELETRKPSAQTEARRLWTKEQRPRLPGLDSRSATYCTPGKSSPPQFPHLRIRDNRTYRTEWLAVGSVICLLDTQHSSFMEQSVHWTSIVSIIPFKIITLAELFQWRKHWSKNIWNQVTFVFRSHGTFFFSMSVAVSLPLWEADLLWKQPKVCEGQGWWMW